MAAVRIACIVPIKDKADVLDRCLSSVQTAFALSPNAEVILVDNGSTDGSLQIEHSYGDFVRTSTSATRVGAVRNWGVRTAEPADILVFVDCDCVVRPDFFVAVENAFRDPRIAASGCEVVSPSGGHWTETVGDILHRHAGDGPRRFINSACFAIRSDWFQRIGGFDETLVSGEDVEICERLLAHGGTLVQSETLQVVHLGNPQTLAQFYRRIRWHGEGAWSKTSGLRMSPTLLAALLHGVTMSLSVVASLLAAAKGRFAFALAIMLVGLLAVPALFTILRSLQRRRFAPPVRGTLLMLVTLTARLHGLFRARLSGMRHLAKA
jgi:GT2 family glycosyltransferase